ncbi:unnamed protein product [Adineta ricciae]|uniref:Uncharacterized protein n=1 Tax=Adineta ricciae TaxID=249248 RepID=A0A814K5D7_ADIRI|nr:unnamed protein product [Adineta ricciae]
MNRNGLVFVPREPPKRVILYPLQDSTSHQQQQLDGIYTRTKTDLLINQRHDTLSQSNNNNRPSRQQTASHPLHNTDATAPSASGHTTVSSAGQRVQNPFYANPFFRPRVITNQQSTITNSLRPTSPTSSSTTTATTTTDITAPANEPSSTTIGTLVPKGRQPFYPRIQSPLLFSNGKPPDPTGTTMISSLPQQESRTWAQSAISTHIVRYNGANERLNGTLKTPEVNTITSDTLKQKVSSATDIVISLMDTSGGAQNPGNISTNDQPARTNGANYELLSNGHLLPSTEQLPSAPPVSLMEISSTANNNNQNWKKALLANFQKNYRNIPAAKLSYTRHPTASSSQTTISSVNEAIDPQQQQHQQQQQMSEGSTVLNAVVVERPLQTSDNPFIVPSTPRRSSESIMVPKPENNLMERSSSLQIPKSQLLSTVSTTTTVNVTQKAEETSNVHRIPRLPMSIPSALLMSKPAPPPTTNIEQQRANITRVMIRRDFVQPLETKPPMPSVSNIRSLMTSQPTKSDPIPANNVIRVATIADNPNRISQSHQLPPARPPTQKSLLSFTTSSSAVKESLRADNNQQKSNGTNSSSTMTTRLSHTGITIGDISSNESRRRRREEVNIRSKRRAASASTTSNYE